MTATNKISNLVVDSTSHIPQIVNERSSPIIESTTTNSNNITQSLSPNDNVCELIINIFSFKIKFIGFLRVNQILVHLIHLNQQVQ
jgi:hypothetical protein